MKRVGWLLLFAIAVTGAFSIVGWCSSRLEYRDVEVEAGLSGAAAANPWLALERYLVEMGIPTVGRISLHELPPEDVVLFLFGPRRALGPDRTRRIVNWVESGGTLVVGPVEPLRARGSLFRPREEATPDYLLDELGLEFRRGEVSASPSTVRFRDPVREFTLKYSERPLTFSGGQEIVWSCEDAGSRSHLGPLAIALRQGRGTLIVLADKNPLRNLELGTHEHAAFVWEVLARQGPIAGAWIVRSDDAPDFFSEVLRVGWPVVAALGVLLALWLWRSALRVGPIVDTPEVARRSLEEHLRAAGRFAWLTGGAPSLLANLRESVRARVRRRHPELSHAPESEVHAVVARWAALDPARVAAAFADDPRRDAKRFVELVRDLQSIQRHT